ncbi:MAG: type I-B CRISPR-associated protein Cas8b1/Cst1 [Calditrichaeota bacterium]|nr:MAG: type I-B CRISPR-associated protein Cas8b1/Cst1 [Calditrichota bacterium]
MLKYTGHPLVDVGIATITAFSGKDDPTELVEEDLDKISDYLIHEYTRQPLKSFATVPFAGGAYFTQPAYKGKPVEKQGTAKILKAYKSDVPKSSERCIFTGEPAIAITLDEKGTLRPGRAARSNIPLITGATVINFHPYGDVGIPVSGEALLAIHAMPLGSAKSAGRLLMVHSDNPELMLHFAREFLKENRQAIQLAQAAGSSKLKESDYSYRTLLIHTLLPAEIMQREAKEDERPFSITAYRLSNSGQDPSLEIYHLPMEILGFLRLMERADFRSQWHAIINRAWEVEPKKKKRKKDTKPFKPRINWLYEDLFDLPNNAAQFIRTYFLRVALRYAKSKDTDPRVTYSTQKEAELVSWEITSRFLRRILHMDSERIEQIRQMGDTLAEYVNGQNDRRFFRDFFTVQRYDYFRDILMKANMAHTKRGNPPLIRFEPYIAVFEDGENLARSDWKLARDLVLIRMVERLYELGWLGRHTDAIPEPNDESEDE